MARWIENPWWGCQKISAACDHCYAETWAKRSGYKVWGPESTTSRRFFGDKHWAEPLAWDREAAQSGERARVFCSSMADVFEGRDDLDEHRARLWGLIERTPNLDWLLLTKRPENIARMVPTAWLVSPRANVWLGTTVEDQPLADVRVAHLLAVPAVVRFVSCEPLRGHVDLAEHLGPEGISWVIAGGESGGKARPAESRWYRSLRDQAVAAGAAFFFKQWGNWVPADERLVQLRKKSVRVVGGEQFVRLPTKDSRELDGRTWDEFPVPWPTPQPRPKPTPMDISKVSTSDLFAEIARRIDRKEVA